MTYELVQIDHEHGAELGRVTRSECATLDEGSWVRIVPTGPSPDGLESFQLHDQLTGMAYHAERNTDRDEYDGTFTYAVQCRE